MKLNASLQAKLDFPAKAFEVAFRCYVIDILLSKYTNETALKTDLQNRVDDAKDAEFIFAGKVSSANKLLGNSNWKAFWSNIEFIQYCYQQKQHSVSHDVTFLGDTILMTYVFQELYQDFFQVFGKPEQYIFYSDKYHEIRNSLSHQGSFLVTKEDASYCIGFIQKGISFIDKKYFWYRSAEDILKDIDAFIEALNMGIPEIENFNMVPFPSNQIVCREPEISDLFRYICGWDGERKLRNRKHLVCVSGYGGVGKTSLVTEFLLQLLDKMCSKSYQGLHPSFVLFYSAKEQMLEFDKISGDLFIKGFRSQFSSFEQLLSCFYRDLGIEKFDDDWNREGILIIDNFEALSSEDRKKTINYIDYDLPTSIQVIITTRIPEHADEQMQLRGFQNEAGLRFIDEYIEKNDIKVVLSQEQKGELIRYSYGNSLVLVLALKRLSSQKASFNSIINEMRRLPQNDSDNSVSQFMFQNTIEEVLNSYPQYVDLVKSVLICLSMRQDALTADILASAHRNQNVTVSDIEEILRLLGHYLIVEKIGDSYNINEFANHFIVISMSPTLATKKEWESRLLTAIRENEQQRMNLEELKKTHPELSDLLKEWNGEGEEESLAICSAFTMYANKNRITSRNAAYEIDQLKLEFDRIEHQYRAHPYIYYQWARILKELRQERVIGDEYNDMIKSNYERSIMLIDTPSFMQIKNTKTYPSVLWIFSIFLLDIDCFDEASRYAYDAVLNFKQLGMTSGDIDDALAIYGIAEAKLFSNGFNKDHLQNARNSLVELKNKRNMRKNVREHMTKLSNELNKYVSFKI